MNWTERLAKAWNLGNAKLQTRNCKLRFAVCLMLKVSIDEIKRRENDWRTDKLTNNKRLFNCDNRPIETHQLHYESSLPITSRLKVIP